MNNECGSKHPDKSWFCESQAFHRGDHRTCTGWGRNMRVHTWPRIEQNSEGNET